MHQVDRYRFAAAGPGAWAAFILLLFLLAAALFQALRTGHPFWTIIAGWALAVMVAPEFVNAILPQARSRWGMVAMAGLFVAYLLLGPARPAVTDINSLLWALPGSVTVFALCLVTLLLVNERGNGHMVRQFLMVTAFLAYMTVMLVQGPIDYYLGMALGEVLVPGNTEFMDYLITITAAGLVLAAVMNGYLCRHARSLINPDGVDWGR
jgi:hypothetical protein